jgi:hypothetical protein
MRRPMTLNFICSVVNRTITEELKTETAASEGAAAPPFVKLSRHPRQYAKVLLT